MMEDLEIFTRDLGLRPQRMAAPMSSSAAAARSTFSSHPLPSPSSMPVYDKPLYDDDEYIRTGSIAAGDLLEDLFASPQHTDDLLESLGRPHREVNAADADLFSSPPHTDDPLESLGQPNRKPQEVDSLDDLIPGFSSSRRMSTDINNKHSAKATSLSNDPFVVLETTSTSAYTTSELCTDPFEHIHRTMNSESTNPTSSSEKVFDDTDVFETLAKSMPLYNASVNDDKQNQSSSQKNIQNDGFGHSAGKEFPENAPSDHFEHLYSTSQNIDNNFEPNGLFERPPTQNFTKDGVAQNSDVKVQKNESDATSDISPRSVDADDVWLTVSEIPLFTQPTPAPPPSQHPPIISKHHPDVKTDYTAPFCLDESDQGFFWQSNQSSHFSERLSNSMESGTCPTNENLFMDFSQIYSNEHMDSLPNKEETESFSAAAESVAAMKEDMNKADTEFKQAREVRESEHDTKSAELRQTEKQKGRTGTPDVVDNEDKERQERLEHDKRQKEREKEEKRLERERELMLERERERQAVERANREARERAAAKARLKAQRASVERANAEARLRAERAVVQRVNAEARERAEIEARERAAVEAREQAEKEKLAEAARERAAADARDKATADLERASVERVKEEARRRAERAAAERVTSEVRERAFAEARERAASTAREQQYRNENDLEFYFGMGVRATSAPKQRANSSETLFDTQNPLGMDGLRKTTGASSSTFRKASSTTNIDDGLTSLFGASSANELRGVEGETEERRRSRIERQQRVNERAAKALAEKNERDLQAQRDQAERHIIAEKVDIEIKRWAAGKEGNLRALLSTLQYVLWPGSGWQPVSLTDLIVAASVKKVYRKATLCIHPDKVQQKGATLQEKYIAEKVFDILKEAWNRFNSEELF